MVRCRRAALREDGDTRRSSLMADRLTSSVEVGIDNETDIVTSAEALRPFIWERVEGC